MKGAQKVLSEPVCFRQPIQRSESDYRRNPLGKMRAFTGSEPIIHSEPPIESIPSNASEPDLRRKPESLSEPIILRNPDCRSEPNSLRNPDSVSEPSTISNPCSESEPTTTRSSRRIRDDN